MIYFTCYKYYKYIVGSYDGRVKMLTEELFLLAELQLPAAVTDLAYLHVTQLPAVVTNLAYRADQLFVW
jgi:hypothetical protein